MKFVVNLCKRVTSEEDEMQEFSYNLSSDQKNDIKLINSSDSSTPINYISVEADSQRKLIDEELKITSPIQKKSKYQGTFIIEFLNENNIEPKTNSLQINNKGYDNYPQ